MPFIKRAKVGGMLNVTEIKHAYEAQIDRPVAPSAIYRLLDGSPRVAQRGSPTPTSPSQQRGPGRV
jgi:hypothetical protein